MSTLRKLTLLSAAVFLALSGTFVATGTAGADCDWNAVPCKTAP